MASTAHLDSKGHHPKVRPYNRHNKHVGTIKMALVSPKATTASYDELLETMVVEMGCPDSGMWYVDTAGCAMLQANDAEPPPQRGWLRKAMQCAAVFLLGLMLLAGPTSCKKDPQPSPTPTPNTPTDTITPVVPGDTITPTPGTDTIVPGPGGDTITHDTIVPPIIPGQKVYFEYRGGTNIVSFDTLERYQNDPAVDSIILRLAIVASPSWTPSSFTALCDSLKPRFTRFPKLRGEWGVQPYQLWPACDSLARDRKGIAEHQRDLLEGWHYGVYLQNKDGGKGTQTSHYNGNQGKKSKPGQMSHNSTAMMLPRSRIGRP